MTRPGFPSRASRWYFPHVCFRCRKSFKRTLRDDECVRTCPDCGEGLVILGRAFKPPRLNDEKQWRKVELLWRSGFYFTAYRRGPGAGRAPKRLQDVAPFLAVVHGAPLPAALAARFRALVRKLSQAAQQAG